MDKKFTVCYPKDNLVITTDGDQIFAYIPKTYIKVGSSYEVRTFSEIS